MGRLIVSMNLSLDGYIEAQGQDDGSWLRIDEEVHRVFNELAGKGRSRCVTRAAVMPEVEGRS
jgi:hypothetical protein